ncbi:sigma 54-interacting transcriptional regulator [Maledivibacter halophilus]|uniref:Sigma 54 modulation protein n=1 Tax=Maledivibacter halophilus TaxID=36842 RepID=A0A1T5MJ45_9FIRM|nr:sigma 54-interacting transcriptional regulator [Maledivibacter halophilus]SKC88093.1 sigma 54 modulation protein [Maledivibacter halophilus]
MKVHLMKLIESEDKKKPYTDDQLAKILGVRRDLVTVLRGELNILNSRERCKDFLAQEIKEIVSQNPKISGRELTRIIKKRGFDVSRYLVSQMRKEIEEENTDEVKLVKSYKDSSEDVNVITTFNEKNFLNKQHNKVLAFKRIIGFDGSLKPQIQQAKAAILYPPHGLHTLILGSSGVGKSHLAEAMYEYALEIGVLGSVVPFVIFNCADYAENPQLLLSQLFGHVKGAYTGAEKEKEGLVEKANGGILFLDEVHRLPPEGQELLYFLMDKGKFRRMGETEIERIVQVLIIAATTEDIESSLLLTFRRRIPMIIELPPLSARPLGERYQIIRNFFNKESSRTEVKIKVTQEALRALLLYDCLGNIGKLKSDIQVACARGFLTYIGGNKGYIQVDLIDLPSHVRRGLLKIENRKPEVENFIKSDLIARPGEIDEKTELKKDLYTLPEEIYKYIEAKYEELELQGLNQDKINHLIGSKIEMKFEQLIEQVERNHQILAKQDLAGIVGQNIVDIVEKVTQIAKERIGQMDNHLFYCFAIHLSATFQRIQEGKPIINPHLEKIMREYKLEYNVAKEIVEYIEGQLNCKIPQDEIGFIAMYLKTLTKSQDVKPGRVGVVVLSHGRVAQGMVEVANRLLGVNHGVGIEMSLDERPESALQRTINVVNKINEGKGVLLLVDMGSLITFGEIITKKTGILTKTVGRVDTVMVLEAVRKAILPDTNLDEIVASIDKDKVGLGRLTPFAVSKNNDKKIIITLCITGEGTALRVKSLIKNMIPDIHKKAKIIPIGVIGNEELSLKIDKIKNKGSIVAIVGTVRPKNNSIPFISLEEIINGKAVERLENILDMELTSKSSIKKDFSETPLAKVIDNELIIVNPNYNTKREALDDLAGLLIKKGYVEEKYLLDVYRRELIEATLIDNIAMPHGEPQNVKKSAIAIAVLKEPIEWSPGIVVENVFMMALKEDSEDIIGSFYNLVKESDLLVKLKNASNSKDVQNIILEILLSSTKDAKTLA